MFLDVSLITPQKILFEGKAKSITFPGEQGVFEILPYHKPFLSLLVSGKVFIDEKVIFIRRGIVKVISNTVTAILEEG